MPDDRVLVELTRAAVMLFAESAAIFLVPVLVVAVVVGLVQTIVSVSETSLSFLPKLFTLVRCHGGGRRRRHAGAGGFPDLWPYRHGGSDPMSIAIPAFDGLEAMTRFTLAGVRPMAMLALLPGWAGWRCRGGRARRWRRRWRVHGVRAACAAADVRDVAGEVLAGLLAGMAIALAFAAAQMAGEVAAQIIGLGFASVPGAGGNVSVIGGFFGMLLWAAFLSGDGYLWLFARCGWQGQGEVLPPGAVGLETLAAYGGVMFAGGLRMALPVVGLLLLGNLLVAVAARSAPQLGAWPSGRRRCCWPLSGRCRCCSRRCWRGRR